MSAARLPDNDSNDSRSWSDASDEIYRVETVPPPAGEDDAYSAPTKVGPLARGAVAKLFASLEAEEGNTRKAVPPTSGVRDALRLEDLPPVKVPRLESIPVPCLYNDEADDDGDSRLEPTSLLGNESPSLKPERVLALSSSPPAPVAAPPPPTISPIPAPAVAQTALDTPRPASTPIEVVILVAVLAVVAVAGFAVFYHFI